MTTRQEAHRQAQARRLTKHRDAILDYLSKAGGSVTRPQIITFMGKKHKLAPATVHNRLRELVASGDLVAEELEPAKGVKKGTLLYHIVSLDEHGRNSDYRGCADELLEGVARAARDSVADWLENFGEAWTGADREIEQLRRERDEARARVAELEKKLEGIETLITMG